MIGQIINKVTRYIPLVEILNTYKKKYIRHDLVSSLTVAIVAIPQSMAYAIIAGSGSFTRSAINYYGGAATRMSGIFSGIIVGIVLLFFSPYAKYIPMPSLAGVIIVIAYNMVNKKEMKID